jgi:hypothetical protein
MIGIASGANAASITFDFTNTVAGDTNLGATENYTVSGITITAASGTYGNAVGSPTNSSFIAGGVLVGNNRGVDEQGLGVCSGSGNSCNSGHFDDFPELDYSLKEVVRLDNQSLCGVWFFSDQRRLCDPGRAAWCVLEYCKQQSRREACRYRQRTE